jgi:hypothetical protein
VKPTKIRYNLWTFAALCAEASAKKSYGASLLNLLHSRARSLSGDSSACAIVQRLLHAATVPYFEVLTKWISAGVLNDPFSEFMVLEVPGMDEQAEVNGQAAIWACGHQIRTRTLPSGAEVDDVPSFLAEVADDVLKAGSSFESS